jgi:hypothetical protein
MFSEIHLTTKNHSKEETKMSDNPKARKGTKKTTSKVKEKEVDLKRLLNVGVDVELSFGKYTIKELDVFSLISIVTDGLEVLVGLSDGGSELDMLRQIASDPEFKIRVAKILALFCGEDDYEPFANIKVKDFVILIKAIQEVLDIEEIKEAFFALGLQKYLSVTPTSTV